MSIERKAFAPLLVAAGGAILIATAPIATADTIRDLEGQGYNVSINPDRSADSPPPESTTVYVDVQCPHDDRGAGISFGF
jgi:hypothetical protein